jgi:uncharacterized protein YxeA
MARRKRKHSGSKVAGKCKTYNIRGQKRKLCFSAKGKIKSNTRVR